MYKIRWKRYAPPYSLLVEESPHLQRILYGSKEYWVYVPWIYYRLEKYIGYKTVGPIISRLYVTNSPIQTTQDKLKQAPFTNLNEGIKPCHYFSHVKEEHCSTDTQLISLALTSWWGSKFNSDYVDYINHTEAWKVLSKDGHRATWQTFKAWQKLTLEEVLNLEYKERTRVEQVIGPNQSLIDLELV